MNLIFIIEDFVIAGYADSKTSYVSANNMDGVDKSWTKLFQWFNENLMKINANRCHLLLSSNSTVNVRVENFDIKNSDCEKHLGIKFNC